MTSSAEMGNSKRAPHCSLERVPKILGVTREALEHRGDPGTAGVDLAAEKLAGSEDDNEDKAA